MNLLDRKSSFLMDHMADLRPASVNCSQRKAFDIDAWEMLPDHMHAIWALPPGDDRYSDSWRAIKNLFSKTIPRNEYRSEIIIKRHEHGIWQRRFWEHTIIDIDESDHVHYNPVKHGWVRNAKEWPHSGFYRLVAEGIYSQDWASSAFESFAAGES